MTEKELRRLKRSDLIEIIYELQKQNIENSDRINSLEQELSDRTLKLSQAGSIAEAAIQVNGVFEAAQAAADQYLASLKYNNDDIECRQAETQRQCDELIYRAQSEADEILKDAKEQATKLLADAEAQAVATWENLETKLDELTKRHVKLHGLMTEDTK